MKSLPSAPLPLSDILQECFEQTRYARAADLARAGRYLEAESLLMPGGSRPAGARELDLLARICAQQRQYERARAFWETALQKSPGSTVYQRGIVRAGEAEQRQARLRKGERMGFYVLVGIVAVACFATWVLRRPSPPQAVGKGQGTIPAPEVSARTPTEMTNALPAAPPPSPVSPRAPHISSPAPTQAEAEDALPSPSSPQPVPSPPEEPRQSSPPPAPSPTP